MADRKLSAETAAIVAAQLTQAQMALTGGRIAGRKPGTVPNISGQAVEKTYLRFLDFIERGATLPDEQNTAAAGE